MFGRLFGQFFHKNIWSPWRAWAKETLEVGASSRVRTRAIARARVIAMVKAIARGRGRARVRARVRLREWG